jgi:hypothetical protein
MLNTFHGTHRVFHSFLELCLERTQLNIIVNFFCVDLSLEISPSRASCSIYHHLQFLQNLSKTQTQLDTKKFD